MHPDSPDPAGTVVVSVDAELGWGHHDLPAPPRERVEYARTGWLRLLSLFEAADLPATWAVVGHLFERDCDGVHADHPASPGWFSRERGSWADRPELRFGPELVDRVREAGPDHELACHGFSHVVWGDPATTPATAEAEISHSVAAAGHGFDSFVFPRNHVAHRAVLAETGVGCYRGCNPVGPAESLAGRLRKVADVVGGAPPVVTPRRDEFGLVNVPATCYLFDFEGVARSLAEPVVGDPVVRRARRNVDAAAESGGLCHLWLHPNNLILERDVQRVRRVFEYVARRREAGEVTVETMAEVAARVD